MKAAILSACMPAVTRSAAEDGIESLHERAKDTRG